MGAEDCFCGGVFSGQPHIHCISGGERKAAVNQKLFDQAADEALYQAKRPITAASPALRNDRSAGQGTGHTAKNKGSGYPEPLCLLKTYLRSELRFNETVCSAFSLINHVHFLGIRI